MKKKNLEFIPPEPPERILATAEEGLTQEQGTAAAGRRLGQYPGDGGVQNPGADHTLQPLHLF